MPAASVIVVNWNRSDLLRECLRSLAAQTYKNFEIIVVDNGSSDGSVEMVRSSFPQARLIALDRNLGFSGGNNAGIRAAGGEYIALLNNDAVAEPRWLEELVSAIEHRPEVGFCASKILLYDSPHLLNSAGLVFFSVGMAMDRAWMQPDDHVFSRVEYVSGACAGAALYRKSMLADIGDFDEDFSPAYYEDVDLSLRAQLRGYKCLYVPRAVARHRHASTLGHQSYASLYLASRNRWYVLVKDVPLPLLAKYGVEIFFYSFFILCKHLVKRDAAPYVRGYLAALRKLPVMIRRRRIIQGRRIIGAREFELLVTRGRLKADLMRELRAWGRSVFGSALPGPS